MNKKEKEITSKEEILRILKKEKYAVIAMCRNNEPYIVTLSYGYDEEKNALFFHSSLKGLKLDFINENPNVCATIIEDRGYNNGQCEHHYSSLVIWGNMSIVQDIEDKKQAMGVLLNHLEENPDPIKERNFKNEAVFNNFALLKLEITELSAKKGN
jgi:nitroimidazol reductase NimA-like FMN-containing flavoprotein (pyridoxamine 5'-phosphate oxidase superfamily)